MSGEVEALTSILSALDSSLALAVAVFFLVLGIKRFDIMQEEHNNFTKTVLDQQQQNNDELMGLVRDLCNNKSSKE